ncbi:DUF4400 domain-containing protein [Duganella vulcania]|uniref:DUF4400 domain-containing protein n=1 Tax=Duganella vulcania TaxID=2692166 RepID=A0A845GEH9_9BURK|nr:DUF4400 domain-containing protein [Duganella vulcania]MYM92704.1 DUF4400 domain-containing protein [Duganella vulcania]
MTFRRFLIWFLIILVEVVIVTVALSSDTISRAASREREMVVSTFGEEMASSIIKRTDVVYKRYFFDSGWIKGSYEAFVPSRDELSDSRSLADMGRPMFKVMDQKLRTFWTAVYYGTQRMTILMMWLPYLMPFVVAVIVDGMATRKKRQFNYEYANPVVFGAMSHAVLALISFPFLYFLLPFPVNPLVSPIWIGVFCLALFAMISHTQRLA